MKEVIQFIENHFILSVTWIFFFGILVNIILTNIFSKVNNITPSEAIHLMNKDKTVIIDLRNINDFNKGHIINSINISESDINDNNLDILKEEKKKSIILVDAGTASQHLAKKIDKIGFFKKVYILEEGISRWNIENLPLVRNK